MARKSSKEIEKIVELLIHQTREHFANEELILEALNFPGLAQHKAAHRRLLGRAESFLAALPSGTLEVGELFQFLAHDVIAKHLLGCDREYFAYLERTGSIEATSLKLDSPHMLH